MIFTPGRRPARIATGTRHFLYSVYPFEDAGMFSAIGFFRHTGKRPFSERESRIAHIVLSEVEWLHYAELPGERGRKVPQLSPRQRLVLIMLAEAHDKDRIADLLHISPHTVKDYMKAIYKHFGVTSQLMELCSLKLEAESQVFIKSTTPNLSYVAAGDGYTVQLWLTTLVVTLLGMAPWLRWRFSLRTLLIATTLVAVVLGAFIAMSR